MFRWSFFLPALLLALLAGGCPKPAGNAGGGAAGTPAGSGKWTGSATDFEFTAYDGTAGRASNYAGKPLVVNFWAVW